jgi:hypothetical protein
MCLGDLFETPTVDTGTSAVSTETEEVSSSESALESKRQALAAKTDYNSTILTSGQGDTSQANVLKPGSSSPSGTGNAAGSSNRSGGGSAVLAQVGRKKKLGQ